MRLKKIKTNKQRKKNPLKVDFRELEKLAIPFRVEESPLPHQDLTVWKMKC